MRNCACLRVRVCVLACVVCVCVCVCGGCQVTTQLHTAQQNEHDTMLYCDSKELDAASLCGRLFREGLHHSTHML